MNLRRISKTVVTWLMVATATLQGCSKKDASPSRTQLITRAGGWKLVGDTLRFEDCDADNTLSFKTSGGFTIDDGTIFCGQDASGGGTWAFINKETQINLKAQNGTTLPLNVDKLDATTLILSIQFGGQAKEVMTYAAI